MEGSLAQVNILGLWIAGRYVDDSPPVKVVAEKAMDIRIRVVNGSEAWDRYKGDFRSTKCHARFNLTLGTMTSQKWKGEYVHPRAYYEAETDLNPDQVKNVNLRVILPVGWEPEEYMSLAVSITVHVWITPTSYEEEKYDYIFRHCLELLSPTVVGLTREKEARMQIDKDERISA